MPKYTKFTKKKYMKKYKRGRSKKGGYYLWPDENDNEWVGTKLKNSVSSFIPSVPNLNPFSYFGKKDPVMADAPDYTPAADAVDNTPVGPPVGQLEYPSYSADAYAGAGAMSSPMEVAAYVAAADADVAADAANVAADDANVAATDADAAETEARAAEMAGGRRRRRRRTTKKRKRSNKRKRTMKRRRSMRRRR